MFSLLHRYSLGGIARLFSALALGIYVYEFVPSFIDSLTLSLKHYQCKQQLAGFFLLRDFFFFVCFDKRQSAFFYFLNVLSLEKNLELVCGVDAVSLIYFGHLWTFNFPSHFKMQSCQPKRVSWKVEFITLQNESHTPAMCEEGVYCSVVLFLHHLRYFWNACIH